MLQSSSVSLFKSIAGASQVLGSFLFVICFQILSYDPLCCYSYLLRCFLKVLEKAGASGILTLRSSLSCSVWSDLVTSVPKFCVWHTINPYCEYFVWPSFLSSWGCAVRQEQELRNGGAVDKKLTTLADLFRPPIDLMHKGSFETVSWEI